MYMYYAFVRLGHLCTLLIVVCVLNVIPVPKCGIPSPPKFFNLAALIWKQFMKFFREPL